jgi:hypothetical protein
MKYTLNNDIIRVEYYQKNNKVERVCQGCGHLIGSGGYIRVVCNLWSLNYHYDCIDKPRKLVINYSTVKDGLKLLKEGKEINKQDYIVFKVK